MSIPKSIARGRNYAAAESFRRLIFMRKENRLVIIITRPQLNDQGIVDVIEYSDYHRLGGIDALLVAPAPT